MSIHSLKQENISGVNNNPEVGLMNRREEIRAYWKELLAATIGTGFGVGTLIFYTTGMFVPSLRTEFGWSLSEISLLPLVGCFIIIITSPFVGRIIDKYGVKIPASVSLIALSASFICLTVSGPSFTSFMLIWIVMHFVAAASTPVSFTRVVTTRFTSMRGLSLGITLGGAGIVAFLVPKLLGDTIASDWRQGYYVLSAAVLAAAIIFWLLLPAKDPVTETCSAMNLPAATETDDLVSRSVKVRLGIIFLLIPLAVSGMTLHLVPLLRASGMNAASAASVMSLVGISVVVGRVGIGFLVDRFFAPAVAALAMLLVASAFALLLVSGPEYAAFAAVGLGLSLGAETDLIGYLTGRYFGKNKYGKVFGIYYSIFNIGLGLSPFAVATLYNINNNYAIPLSITIILLLLASALLFSLPAFKEKES